MTRAKIKEKAKKQLGNQIFSNSWMVALLICLTYSIIFGVAGMISSGILLIILTGPFAYGLSYVFLKQANDNQTSEVEDLFKGFKDDFGQTCLINIMSGLFIFLWSLLFIIPGIVKSYAYSMAYYIKVDHPKYDWKKCIDESEKIMQGHKMDLFILDLSFIGWYIVGALCFGIGTLWVTPYSNAARAQFYNSIK